MQQAIEYIKRHWHKGESLKEVAEQFGVDGGNLERAFRLAEGRTAKRYIDKQRKRFVLKSLRCHHAYGYEIGLSLGFKTDRAFYKWVKRAFGLTFRELSSSVQIRHPPGRRMFRSDKK